MRVCEAALAASVATGATAVVTGANRLGALSVSTLAASPQAVGDGKVWLILTSGLLADRPAVPSLIGFWLVGFAVLLLCSARVAVGVALGGHTFSALGVYGIVGFARLLDPHAFASVVYLADYGLSAMIAAWLGAIARTFWRRHRGRLARLLIAAGSVGSAGIGLALRPEVTFLDSEHLLAYAIGLALVDGAVFRGLARPSKRLVAATASMLLASRGS